MEIYYSLLNNRFFPRILIFSLVYSIKRNLRTNYAINEWSLEKLGRLKAMKLVVPTLMRVLQDCLIKDLSLHIPFKRLKNTKLIFFFNFK